MTALARIGNAQRPFNEQERESYINQDVSRKKNVASIFISNHDADAAEWLMIEKDGIISTTRLEEDAFSAAG